MWRTDGQYSVRRSFQCGIEPGMPNDVKICMAGLGETHTGWFSCEKQLFIQVHKTSGTGKYYLMQIRISSRNTSPYLIPEGRVVIVRHLHVQRIKCYILQVVQVLSTNMCVCAEPERYSRDGTFYCSGTQLNRPLNSHHAKALFQKYFIEIARIEGSEDSLPALLWKTYLAVQNASSVFPNDELNFEDYVTFMTSKYPVEFSKNIKNAVIENCTNVEDESEPWEKMMKYAQCFYRNEKQVCVTNQATENYFEMVKGFESTCERLPGAGWLDGCCKDKPIPVDFANFVQRVLINATRKAEKVFKKDFEECQKTISDRQKMLQGRLKSSQRVHTDMCDLSCAFRPQKYVDMNSLKLNFTDEIENHALEFLPQALRLKIKEIIPKYKKSVQYEKRTKDGKSKLVTHAQHVQQFNETTDELEKIRLYCVIPESYDQILATAFIEYCLGADAVKTVLKDFLVEE